MLDKGADGNVGSASQIGLVALLEDSLDVLELGVGLFDANLRLVECNRLFRKIRDYPTNLCQRGAPLAELLRHDLLCGQLDASGQEDPVDHWLERATRRQRHTAETACDDGRSRQLRVTTGKT